MSIQKITHDSMAVSSVKGLPRIMKSETTCLRALWIIGVLALLAVCANEVYKLTSQYLAYPITTSIYG